MAKFGKFDMRGMKELQKRMEKLQDPEKFMEDCAKELAARLLARVVKLTPVGEYDKPVDFTTKEGAHVHFQPHTGKKGGTLRRGWTAAQDMTVKKEGNKYVVEIINPVEYASYVEYGHRTPDGKGWVKGRFMMTISENELQQIAPQILEAKVKKYLKGIVK